MKNYLKQIKKWIIDLFKEEIDFTNLSDSQLKDYILHMNVPDSEEHDYTREFAGHCLLHITPLQNKMPKTFEMIGYNSNGRIVGGKGRLKKGDIMFLNTTNSDKIGRFLVLEIEYLIFPDNRFTAVVVGMGYKSNKKENYGIIHSN